ncbi:MAG: hypothetical protein K0R47_4909, partial [Brevibacillus sp.]|nr:hypothetical protein [Brevibacillus sp.]
MKRLLTDTVTIGLIQLSSGEDITTNVNRTIE